MKPMTATDLRSKNTVDLEKRVSELRKAISEHVFDRRTKEVKSIHGKRLYKRELAKALSVLNERNQREGEEK